MSLEKVSQPSSTFLHTHIRCSRIDEKLRVDLVRTHRGWGCGYKNLQMLISSARHLPQYQELLNELTTSSTASNPSTSSTTRTNGGAEVVFPIPTILELQEIIQTAWSLGEFEESLCRLLCFFHEY